VLCGSAFHTIYNNALVVRLHSKLELGGDAPSKRSLDAHKVGRWHVVQLACESEMAGGSVELKHRNRVSVLIGNDQELATGVELKVPRCSPTGVAVANQRQRALQGALVVDAEHRQAVVATVGHQHKAAGGVDGNATTGVELARERRWSGLDALDQTQSLCLGRSILTALFSRTQCCSLVVKELEYRHGRCQFVDQVRDVESGMEFNVSWAMRSGSGSGCYGSRRRELSFLGIIHKLLQTTSSQVSNNKQPHSSNYSTTPVQCKSSKSIKLRRQTLMQSLPRSGTYATRPTTGSSTMACAWSSDWRLDRWSSRLVFLMGLGGARICDTGWFNRPIWLNGKVPMVLSQ
jgi:hypothetical protein